MSSNGIMDDMPWLQPGAIEVMEKFLAQRNDIRVFEWGAGGSTLFFSAHAKRVFSVEHDLKWLNSVADRLAYGETANVQLSWVSEFSTLYHKSIFYEDFFDLILVDGVQRNECIGAAISCIEIGGMIVVDNTERAEEYAEGLSLLKDWKRQDFVGDWTTSIFIKQ